MWRATERASFMGEHKMRYSDKLRGKYIDEIREWDWEKLRRGAELQVPDGCDEPCWVNYVGGVLNLYPSGKIYAPWTSNQTARDVIRDEVFNEALDAVAEEHGAYITGDSGDIFACWPHEDELAEAAE
jgi:hypothetical protein